MIIVLNQGSFIHLHLFIMSKVSNVTIFIIVVDKKRFTVTMLKPIQRPRMPPELATNQITWTGGQQLPN